MKKLIIALLAMLVLNSCGEPELSPVQLAIKDKVSGQLGEVKSIFFKEIALVDSSTFADEIARRRKAIEIRHKQNLKLANDYESKGKPTNARIKREAAAKDQKVLDGIKAIEERLAANDSLGKTELYRYKFSAIAKMADGSSSDINDMYIAITPENEIIGMDYKKDGVFKAGGSLIPGYKDLF